MEIKSMSRDLMESTLRIWMKNTSELGFIKDSCLRYIMATKPFLKMVDKESNTAIYGCSDFDIFDSNTATKYYTHDMRVLETGEDIVDVVEPMPGYGGKKSFFSISRFALRDRNGSVIGLLGIGRDVTLKLELDEAQKSSRKLEKLASTDAMTGLLNRDAAMSQMRKVLWLHPNRRCALMFIDLDCFKAVNDSFGHPYGDNVLHEIAARLQELCLEENDIVGRVGGDEFLIFTSNVSSCEEVRKKAEAICASIPLHLNEDGKYIHITCSIGISIYEGDGKTLERLYWEADRAMYNIKAKGKNSIAFYAE